MSKLYYKNLRYKGSFPVIKSLGLPLDAAMYKGIVIGEETITPEPSIDYSHEYFTITSWVDNNTISVKHAPELNFMIYKSYDKNTWIAFCSSGTETISLDKGESVYLRADTPQLSTSDDDYHATNITATGYFEASGNIMSLLKGDNFADATKFNSTDDEYGYNAYGLFEGATTLVTLENLVLPSTQYNIWCYQSFCKGCSSLVKAPKELPAQTYISNNTFVWMFYECTKLQESPIIRCTENASGDGWYQMFANDSNLNRVICLLEGQDLYVKGYNWLGDTSASGVFYKASGSTWQEDEYAIPSGWTTRNWSEDSSNFIKVTATPSDRYSCIITGTSDYYQSGDTATIKCTPINGHSFNGWYVNGTLVSSSATYTFTVTSNVDLVPNIGVAVPVNVTLSSNDANYGYATKSGDEVIGGELTLTAEPEWNGLFQRWDIDPDEWGNPSSVLLDNPATYTLTGDTTIVCRFAEQPYKTVTIVSADSTMGSLLPTVSGSTKVYVNNSVAPVAYANTGYGFAGWYVNNTLYSTDTQIYIGYWDVSNNDVFEARFYAIAPATVTLSVNDSSLGSTNGATGDPYESGEPIIDTQYGTTSQWRFPLSNYYCYSKCQFIIDQSVYGSAQTISSFGLWCNQNSATLNLDVYMWHTSDSNFSQNAFVTGTTNSLVFSGNVSFNNNELTTITLDTPFVYNGTDNIMFTIINNTGNWTDGYVTILSTPVDDTSTVYGLGVYRDSSTFNIGDDDYNSGEGNTVVNLVPILYSTVTAYRSYYTGDEVTIVATPSADCRFDGWYNGNECISTDARYTFTLMSNVSYEARFHALTPATITVTSNNTAYGTVSKSPETNYVGDEVTISAYREDDGYSFKYWDINPDGQGGYDERVYNYEYTFTVTGNTTCAATFDVTETKQIYIGVNDSSKGHLFRSGFNLPGYVDVPDYYIAFSVYTYANDGYTFDGWYKNNEFFSSQQSCDLMGGQGWNAGLTAGDVFEARFS